MGSPALPTSCRSPSSSWMKHTHASANAPSCRRGSASRPPRMTRQRHDQRHDATLRDGGAPTRGGAGGRRTAPEASSLSSRGRQPQPHQVRQHKAGSCTCSSKLVLRAGPDKGRLTVRTACVCPDKGLGHRVIPSTAHLRGRPSARASTENGDNRVPESILELCTKHTPRQGAARQGRTACT